MNLNRAMIIGNATRDPEVRTTSIGTPVANFGVATNRVYIDKTGQRQEEVEFHDIVAWGKLGEICGQYIRKGRKIYVEGRLKTRSWDDPAGFKRYKTEIIADNMILLDRPPDGNYQSYQGQSYSNNQKPSQLTQGQSFQTTPRNTDPFNQPKPIESATATEDLPVIQTESIDEAATSEQAGISNNSENNEKIKKQDEQDEEEVSVEDLPF